MNKLELGNLYYSNYCTYIPVEVKDSDEVYALKDSNYSCYVIFSRHPAIYPNELNGVAYNSMVHKTSVKISYYDKLIKEMYCL